MNGVVNYSLEHDLPPPAQLPTSSQPFLTGFGGGGDGILGGWLFSWITVPSLGQYRVPPILRVQVTGAMRIMLDAVGLSDHNVGVAGQFWFPPGVPHENDNYYTPDP